MDTSTKFKIWRDPASHRWVTLAPDGSLDVQPSWGRARNAMVSMARELWIDGLFDSPTI